jgi:hypothetical protein
MVQVHVWIAHPEQHNLFPGPQLVICVPLVHSLVHLANSNAPLVLLVPLLMLLVWVLVILVGWVRLNLSLANPAVTLAVKAFSRTLWVRRLVYPAQVDRT